MAITQVRHVCRRTPPEMSEGGDGNGYAPKALSLAISLTVVFALILMNLSPTAAQAISVAERIERAATLIQNNRIEEAERELNRILRARPNEATALNMVGTIRARQGRLNEAETLFTRAISIDNRLVGARMNLAYLYLLKGAPEKSALQLKEVLLLSPDNADASYRLAWVMLNQGRYDECISVIDRAKQYGPAAAPLLAVLGDALLKKSDVDGAEKSYLLALGDQGNNADAILGLAVVARSRGNSSEAVRYLSRAKSVMADSPDLLFKFAQVALGSEMAGEAILALKRAIVLRGDEPSYHFVLGVTWLEKPDLQEAEEAFRQSLKLRADDAQAQMYLGYSLLKQKKYPEARTWLEKSIRNESATPETFYYLGLIAQEQGEDERAVGLFEKAIRLSPPFGHAHIALGSTYLKMKNYSRAQQEIETGVKLNPDDSKAHYNLALLYTRLGDPHRAQEEMQIVEKLKGSTVKSKDADILTPPSLRPR